ncbi:hypothetical protein V8C26DRAFT_61011 [Trichoderma gracile]
MAFNPDPAIADYVPHNPETYVHFALAAYVFLNPPEGKDPIMYVGGKPVTKTRFWAAMAQKHQGA